MKRYWVNKINHLDYYLFYRVVGSLRCFSSSSSYYLGSTSNTMRTRRTFFGTTTKSQDYNDDITNTFQSMNIKVRTAQDASLTSDWTNHYHTNKDTIVVEPSTVEQVADIIKYCYNEKINVIPVAGNTGLVGGTMPVSNNMMNTKNKNNNNNNNNNNDDNNYILLSIRKLNQIYTFNKTSGIVQCQGGVILQDLQEYANQNNYIIPIDLGSRGSCCIGGNVATNAGGQYYYRYGSIAANILGLQVVTGTGQILNLNYNNNGICNIKDNTGYKLHQLFIGSEGTLGIITGISLLCHPLLNSRCTALLALDDNFDCVLETMTIAKQDLGETLAAFEWMDNTVIDLVATTHPNQKIPLLQDDTTKPYPNYILVETHGTNVKHDQEKMELFLNNVINNNIITNGLVAQDIQQSDTFWKIRELANPSAAASGYTYKYDISIPGSNFIKFINEMQYERLSKLDDHNIIVKNPNWGHILDGNLHYNVTTINKFDVDETVLSTLEPYLFEVVHQRYGGSISAEHGIGQSKNRYMDMIHDQSNINIMKKIKNIFDPVGILNRGKVLPP